MERSRAQLLGKTRNRPVGCKAWTTAQHCDSTTPVGLSDFYVWEAQHKLRKNSWIVSLRRLARHDAKRGIGTTRRRSASGRVVGRPESCRRSARSSRGRGVACRLHRGSHRRPADLSVVSGSQDPPSQVVRHSELSAGNRRGRRDGKPSHQPERAFVHWIAEEHLAADSQAWDRAIALVAGQG